MRLALGYVPLVDAAPLVVAVEGGFTAREGLAVDLVCAPSWATLRDKLALGHLDGAHMLAPLAIASALGISGPQTRLAVPMALNLNGNAVTVSLPLWAAMAPEAGDVETVARAFARLATERAAAGRPLTFGTVHPFSSHSYQLRLFAARGGLDLDRAVELVVIPPPQIAEALRHGRIDGFCVGSPWNSVAVAEGYGRIAAFGSAIRPDCPEKVLALPDYALAASAPLIRAVRRAGEWCAAPENRPELARLLADPRHLGVDPALILRALEGRVIVDPDGTQQHDARYVVFGAGAGRPAPDQADWFLDQMEAGGQIRATPAQRVAARALYRPDLYDAALPA